MVLYFSSVGILIFIRLLNFFRMRKKEEPPPPQETLFTMIFGAPRRKLGDSFLARMGCCELDKENQAVMKELSSLPQYRFVSFLTFRVEMCDPNFLETFRVL